MDYEQAPWNEKEKDGNDVDELSVSRGKTLIEQIYPNMFFMLEGVRQSE
jgi:hypothetical protein